MSVVPITADLLKELRLGIASAPLQPHPGEVFHGQLRGVRSEFGFGKPHYGLVRGNSKSEGQQPLVPLAPITSNPKSRKRKGVLILPKGTLPRKKEKGDVESYVLLFLPSIRIPETKLNGRGFRLVTRLSDRLVEQMNQVIQHHGVRS